jgi:hypothetical protein
MKYMGEWNVAGSRRRQNFSTYQTNRVTALPIEIIIKQHHNLRRARPSSGVVTAKFCRGRCRPISPFLLVCKKHQLAHLAI